MEAETASGPPTAPAWIMPRELTAPTPRRVRMSDAVKISITISTLLFSFLILVFSLFSISDRHKHVALQDRGISTIGSVTALYKQPIKGGIAYHVGYSYRADRSDRSTTSVLTADDTVLDVNFYSLHIGDDVPVVYDAEIPDRSMLNIGSSVYFYDTGLSLFSIFFFLTIFVLFMFIHMATFLLPYFRERRLLQSGEAASAVIVGERDYSQLLNRDLPLSVVTYRFTDADGNTRQGKRKRVPRKDDKRLTFPEARARLLTNPTVVFDPRDSRRHLLYPPHSAELR